MRRKYRLIYTKVMMNDLDIETVRPYRLPPWKKDLPEKVIVEYGWLLTIYNGRRVEEYLFFWDKFEAQRWLVANGFDLLRDERF